MKSKPRLIIEIEPETRELFRRKAEAEYPRKSMRQIVTEWIKGYLNE